MFVARNIIRKNKLIKNFISTSNVLNCDERRGKNATEDLIQKGNRKDEKITKTSISSERGVNKISDISSEESFSKNPKYTNAKERYRSKKVLSEAKKKPEKNSVHVVKEDLQKTNDEILNFLKNVEVSSEIEKLEGSNYRGQSFLAGSEKKIFSQFAPLNIFNPDIMKETESEVKLKIWNDLEAEELNYLSKTSPKNCFEEMIAWTNEGKLWHFPIDNDQGMEKEAEISFTEHIFLEQHLEPWCPKKGPLRKFMELVLIGLSKNHIYTLKEKKEHIDWFRNYFEEKKKILQELGATAASKEAKEIGISSPKKNT